MQSKCPPRAGFIGKGTKYRKSAVRIASVDRFDVHMHFLLDGFKYEQMTHIDDLQLNHYRIQSMEYFRKVKMRRGDVADDQWESLRTMEYFKENDKASSTCVDTELCSKLGCCES